MLASVQGYSLFLRRSLWAAFVLALWTGLSMLPSTGIAASPPPGTPISNTASVTYEDANGNPMPKVSDTVQTLLSGAPLLTITKMESSNPVGIGSVLVYTIHYENTGNTDATMVELTDIFSRHVTFQSASDDGSFTPGTSGGGIVSWYLGTVGAGKNGAVTVTVKVKTPSEYALGDPETITTGTLIQNSATLTSLECTDQHTITTIVGNAPNLIVTKYTTSGPVIPGGNITYSIDYRNRGNLEATNVRIRDGLPLGTKLVPGSIIGGGILSDSTLEWNLGSVDPGESGQVGFQVMISPLAMDGDTVRNSCTLLSNELPVIASNEVFTTVSSTSTLPILNLIKTDTPDPVFVNNNLTYTIQVTNNGAAPLTGIVIRDPVPANTLFVSSSGGDTGGMLVGNLVEWNLENLDIGATAIVQLVVQVDSDAVEGSVIQNRAEVIAKEIPYPSPTTTTTVSARTPGMIEFFDSSWNSAKNYKVGDRICIQVIDEDQNKDTSEVDTIIITLEHPRSGDSEIVELTETDASSGVFRGCVFSDSEDPAVNNGVITVSRDSILTCTYTDPFDASPVSQDTILIDPYGVVFNSVTGLPVQGAVVTIYWRTGPGTGVPADMHPLWPAGQPAAVTTEADGTFAFPLVPPGTYYFEVNPGTDYVFPSVVPTSELMPGFVVGIGSRGEDFTLADDDPPLNLDIPVDPPPGQLNVVKNADRHSASVGDIVKYMVTLTNVGESPVTNIRIVDRMPHGIQYIEGSTRINDVKSTDPQMTGERRIVWGLDDIPDGESAEIGYSALVGPDSTRGDGENIVYANGVSLGQIVASNTARFKLKITGGVFTENGTIIGKIYLEENEDRSQALDKDNIPRADINENGIENILEREAGISGVVLFLEDGTRVTTDRNGKFSLYGVKPGIHVLRVDETTLPEDLELILTNNRSMGSPSSQFVDMVHGLIFKSNFAVKRMDRSGKISTLSEPQAEGTITGSSENAVSGLQIAGDISPPTETAKHETARDYEEEIKEMTQDLSILSPLDGSTIDQSNTDIHIKAPLGAYLDLWVNDEKIFENRIGKRIAYESGRVIINEYVGIDLLAGETNLIRAEVRDSFGNIREKESISVTAVGSPGKIELKPERLEIPADGKTAVKINVSILDRNGIPVTNCRMVTVDSSMGEIMEEDIDPRTLGHQIPCFEGSALFTIKAPYETGAAEITAIKDDVKESVSVFFVPYLRDMIVAGLGELILGYGSSSGKVDALTEDRMLDKGGYADGRGAFFAKGKITKDILLTAAFDSEKEDTDELMRARDADIESEEKYPIYGDESKLGYEAVSKKKFYVKLEKNRSYFLFGDYQTQLNESKLGAYSRTFNGVKLEVDTDKFKLNSFVTETDYSQVVNTLRGRGISGYYYLDHQTVIEGSEIVVLETRDRWRPDRVIKRERLSRWSDYSMDYESGRILFKSPVSSHDADFNPIYIIVSYEIDEGGVENYIYGGHGSLAIADWLDWGFTAIREENEIDASHIMGSDMTVKLPLNTTMKLEWAQTESIFNIENGYSKRRGHGWLAEIETNPFDRLDVSAYYSNMSDFFGNISAVDVMRGTEKYGVDTRYSLNKNLSLHGNYFDENDKLNDTEYQHASLGLEKKFEGIKVDIELLSEKSNDNYIPVTQRNSREPFDISEETPEDFLGTRIAIEAAIGPDLSLLLAHKQDFEDNDYSLSQAGLTYDFNDLVRAYVREEYARFSERTETRTLIGIESEVAKNTVAFSEYQLAGGADGSRNQQIIGLRNRFMLGEKITGNFSVENTQTVRGSQRESEPDVFGIAGGLEYLIKEDLKITSRLEYHKEDSDPSSKSYLGELGVAYKLGSGLSMLLKERYSAEHLGGSEGKRINSRTILGFAYRPVYYDRFNALSKLEYKKGKDTIQEPIDLSDAFIASLEGIYQLNKRVQLIGKYAGKLTREKDFKFYTDLLSGRILYDITDRFDFGLEYRVMKSHDVNNILHGGSIELGYRLIKNLWASIGYSMDDFDSDLTGDHYSRKGPYLKIRFKFDEDLFGRHKILE